MREKKNKSGERGGRGRPLLTQMLMPASLSVSILLCAARRADQSICRADDAISAPKDGTRVSRRGANRQRVCVSVRDKERAVTGGRRGEGGTGAVVAAARVR